LIRGNLTPGVRGGGPRGAGGAGQGKPAPETTAPRASGSTTRCSWRVFSTVTLGGPQGGHRWVCVENVGANAFPQVAELFWLLPLLPDENMQVSGVRAVQ
jgi:hypothetical protein